MSLINCPRCTHIKVTGHRCGSPALRGEHFCYFHARMIKGVRYRVDTKVNPSALLEDAESIQVAVMDITTQLMENSIDWRRASLILRALQIAVRNARGVQFGRNCQQMVRQVPDWDRQYLKEHGEKPVSKKEWEQQIPRCARDDKEKKSARPGSGDRVAGETQQQVPRLALPREARSSVARDDKEKRDAKATELQVSRFDRDDKKEQDVKRDHKPEADSENALGSGGRPAASAEKHQQVPRLALPHDARSSVARDDQMTNAGWRLT